MLISIAAVTELPPPAVEPEDAAPPVFTVKELPEDATVNISKF